MEAAAEAEDAVGATVGAAEAEEEEEACREVDRGLVLSHPGVGCVAQRDDRPPRHVHCAAGQVRRLRSSRRGRRRRVGGGSGS